jgi:hypothetical protein
MESRLSYWITQWKMPMHNISVVVVVMEQRPSVQRGVEYGCGV